MEYRCVQARFLFFNGDKDFTVEFDYCIMMWFVFKGNEKSGAIYQKKVNPSKSKTPTRELAEDILLDYLETQK